MTKYLTEFDPSASDLFEENRPVFDRLLSKDGARTFEKHLQNYAFGDALAELQVATGEGRRAGAGETVQ